MTSAEFAVIGFTPPRRPRARRDVAPAYWVAAIALVLSIAIDAAAVSVAKPNGGCAAAPAAAAAPADAAR